MAADVTAESAELAILLEHALRDGPLLRMTLPMVRASCRSHASCTSSFRSTPVQLR